jgi:hypothetical protein
VTAQSDDLGLYRVHVSGSGLFFGNLVHPVDIGEGELDLETDRLVDVVSTRRFFEIDGVYELI